MVFVPVLYAGLKHEKYKSLNIKTFLIFAFFLLEAAFEQAKRVLQEHETITLSNVERDRFFCFIGNL